VARLPDIQLFACPACAKLYKRKVDVWIDMRDPRPPSSPPSHVPRICVCGRSFLLAESTIVANLPASQRKRRDVLDEFGMDELDIPAFLRKREDSDDLLPVLKRSVSHKKRVLHAMGKWLSQMLKDLAARLKKPERKTKKDLVQSVLLDMETIAIPERIHHEAQHEKFLK
jgi:hypothetical protein